MCVCVCVSVCLSVFFFIIWPLPCLSPRAQAPPTTRRSSTSSSRATTPRPASPRPQTTRTGPAKPTLTSPTLSCRVTAAFPMQARRHPRSSDRTARSTFNSSRTSTRASGGWRWRRCGVMAATTMTATTMTTIVTPLSRLCAALSFLSVAACLPPPGRRRRHQVAAQRADRARRALSPSQGRLCVPFVVFRPRSRPTVARRVPHIRHVARPSGCGHAPAQCLPQWHVLLHVWRAALTASVLASAAARRRARDVSVCR